MARRVLRGCAAVMAPDDVAEAFAEALSAEELQAAVRECPGRVPEDLGRLVALVLQTVVSFEVRWG